MDGMEFRAQRYPQRRKKKKELILPGMGMYGNLSSPKVKEVFLAQLVRLGCVLHCLASGPSASAVGAPAVPARPASSPKSVIVAR